METCTAVFVMLFACFSFCPFYGFPNNNASLYTFQLFWLNAFITLLIVLWVKKTKFLHKILLFWQAIILF